MTSRRIDFDISKKEEPLQEPAGLLLPAVKALMSNNMKLKSVLDNVEQDAVIMWVSNGDWSMHELLVGLMNITGPAVVTFSSYAICEDAARVFAQLKEARMIKELYCLLDNRVDVRSANSLQLMKNICDHYALINTHAKVTLIENSEWRIAVVGSANYTTNKRYESGIVTTSNDAVLFQKKWITEALNNASN